MMHNPPHPGVVFREAVLEPLGLTITEAAERLGVTRKTLSELVNGHSGISPEMAVRIGKATDTSPESWLIQQTHYDLWQAEKKTKRIKVGKLEAAA